MASICCFFSMHLLNSFISLEISVSNSRSVSCFRIAWLWQPLACSPGWQLCWELSGCYSSLTKKDQTATSFAYFYIWGFETGCKFITWLYKMKVLPLAWVWSWSAPWPVRFWHVTLFVNPAADCCLLTTWKQYSLCICLSLCALSSVFRALSFLILYCIASSYCIL